MSSTQAYLNFELLIDGLGNEGSYRVRVINSPAGQASQDLVLPFTPIELENFIVKVARSRSLDIDTVDIPSTKRWGTDLYNCIFSGAVSELFTSSLIIARHQNKGLRICFRLSSAPHLINVPWELLYDERKNSFVGLSANTPIVRKLDLINLPQIHKVESAVQILVMISNPEGYHQLDVEREWSNIDNATKSLQEKELIKLTRISPSLGELQSTLRDGAFHAFHYIGHGGFKESIDPDGFLVLEDSNKNAHLVSGDHLGTILADENTIQLVVLNSCSGARTSKLDPFAGVGQSLLQKGLPYVIAMQFEISDEAAITFSGEFYGAIADGYTIDAATAEARKMIYVKPNEIEWATPVLYTSLDSDSALVKKDNFGFLSKFKRQVLAYTAKDKSEGSLAVANYYLVGILFACIVLYLSELKLFSGEYESSVFIRRVMNVGVLLLWVFVIASYFTAWKSTASAFVISLVYSVLDIPLLPSASIYESIFYIFPLSFHTLYSTEDSDTPTHLSKTLYNYIIPKAYKYYFIALGLSFLYLLAEFFFLYMGLSAKF